MIEPSPMVADRAEIRKRILDSPNTPDSHYAEATKGDCYKKRKDALSKIDRCGQFSIFQLLGGGSPITADRIFAIGQA